MKPRVGRPRTGREGAPVSSSGGSWMGFLICLWPEPSWPDGGLGALPPPILKGQGRSQPWEILLSVPSSAPDSPVCPSCMCPNLGPPPATPAPSRGPQASRFWQL